MSFIIVVLCLALLIVLISYFKVDAFIAFLISSILAGIALGIPLEKLPDSVNNGIGSILGGLTLIIVLGAMLGKLVAESGAAQKIASVMVSLFGTKHIQWGLMVTGFVVGIPLFYGIGFVLLVPLIFSIVYKYKLPAVYIGLPMLAALSVTHGFLPPHPSPVALVVQFNANIGLTLIYGLCLAIPAIIIAGPVFGSRLKHIKSGPVTLFEQKEDSGVSNELATSLEQLPVHPLILGWLISAVIRLCVGSATVAALTAAGVVMPLVTQTGANPNLMVLSLGAGSLMFSHVNDSGFWMFKEYFNLSIKDTICSWSIMETIVSVVGLIEVMILNMIV